MRFSSRIAAISAGLVVPLFAVLMPAASAQINVPPPFPATGHIEIVATNKTKYDAWVDLSGSTGLYTWKIEKAFCLLPHSSYDQTMKAYHEIRVRAEVKLHGCASGTHKVVYVERNIVRMGRKFYATITENVPGAFGMSMEP